MHHWQALNNKKEAPQSFEKGYDIKVQDRNCSHNQFMISAMVPQTATQGDIRRKLRESFENILNTMLGKE